MLQPKAANEFLWDLGRMHFCPGIKSFDFRQAGICRGGTTREIFMYNCETEEYFLIANKPSP